ncbi:MAG: hypothetical protein ABI477_05330 [Chryseolinea sp.]
MTSERRKSIIVLASTLVLGVLLGLLVPGVFFKLSDRGAHGGRGRGDHDAPQKKEWFVGMINHVIRPDSLQSKRIKPITEWAATRIDSIEQHANGQMASVLDSVKNQLKPIVTADQQKRLDEFDTRAKGNWNRGRHH